MNKSEIVKAAYGFNGSGQNAYLSDDFRWTDELGSPPMDKDSFGAMGSLMGSAFPDMSMDIDGIQEEGDGLVVTSHFSGTFTNDLDLSAMGMGVIPATGKMVVFPSQRDAVSFDGDKISEIHNKETGPDAGMAGVFKKLGAARG